MTRSKDILKFAAGSEAGRFWRGKTPTSLDGMSPKKPALLAMGDIPVAPGIKSHSIIPVKGKNDHQQGADGVVAYKNTHVHYVESQLIVAGGHSCLNQPATIEEVRPILHEHLAELDAQRNAAQREAKR